MLETRKPLGVSCVQGRPRLEFIRQLFLLVCGQPNPLANPLGRFLLPERERISSLTLRGGAWGGWGEDRGANPSERRLGTEGAGRATTGPPQPCLLRTPKAGVFGTARGQVPLPPPSPRPRVQGGENSAICVSTPRAKSIPTVATREASSSPGLLGGVVLKKGGGCSCLLHRSPVQGTRSRPPRVPDGAMVSNAAASLDAAAAVAGGSPGQRPGFNSHPGTGPRVAR